MIQQILSPELVQAIGWTLVHSLWQAAAFALGLGGLLVVLRKFSARARYNVAISTLVAFFMTVVLTFGGLYEASPASTTSPKIATRSVDLSTAVGDKSFEKDFESAAENSYAANAGSSGAVADNTQSATFKSRMINYYNDHLPLIVTLWLMGVLFLQLRFIGQLAYLQRLKNYGTERFPAKWAPMLQELEAAIGVSKPVRYLSSFRVGSPFTAGWLRPVVLFPATLLAELQEPELRTIMAHELAHIKRHDFLVNLAQTLLCILFFYHPAVWWMSSRIEEEREHCCDDLAIAVTGERVGYAKTLIQLKESEATPQMAMGYLGQGGGFKQRVTRLLSGYLGTGTYGEGFTSAVIIACIMALAVTLSAQRDNVGTASGFKVGAGATLPTADPAAPALPVKPERPQPPHRPPPPGGNHIDIFDENTDPRDYIMPAEDSTAFNFLLEACDDGNVELARFLLKQGVDVNKVDWNGWTPLMVAAGENQSEIVKILIAAGADVDYVNRNGWTALIEAADEGSYESAELLLAAGADVNLTGPGNNRTPLAMAASEGHPKVFALLVGAGADVFSVTGESSPLHEAAEEGQLDIVKRLISMGADAGARDEDGRTPLSYAAEEGFPGIVYYLLKNGVNPNDSDDEGLTALHYAAHESQVGVIHELLARGAQPSIKDHNGRTALEYALEELGSLDLYWKHTDEGSRPSSTDSRKLFLDHPIDAVIKSLVEAGAKSPNVGIDVEGIYIIEHGHWGDANERFDHEGFDGEDEVRNRAQQLELQRRGRTNKANEPNEANTPNEPNGEGSPRSDDLVDAVAKGQNDRIDYLIGRGDNLNGTAPNGRTPLTEASLHNFNIHTHQLVKGGADIDQVDGNGFTPLTMAATHNNYSTFDHLLQLGAEPDLADGNGMTAKAIALSKNFSKLLRLLNAAGGNVTAEDNEGMSPLMLPALDGNLESLRFLLNEGADPDGGSECSPVFYAAQERQVEAIRLLARYKADVDKSCNYHDSDFFGRQLPANDGMVFSFYYNAPPLLLAITQKDFNTAKALLDAGADPNASCNKYQYYSHDPINPEVAENMSLRTRAEKFVLTFEINGWSALKEAVQADEPELVRILLEAGARKKNMDTSKRSVMDLAQSMNNPAVIKLLTE